MRKIYFLHLISPLCPGSVTEVPPRWSHPEYLWEHFSQMLNDLSCLHSKWRRGSSTLRLRLNVSPDEPVQYPHHCVPVPLSTLLTLQNPKISNIKTSPWPWNRGKWGSRLQQSGSSIMLHIQCESTEHNLCCWYVLLQLRCSYTWCAFHPSHFKLTCKPCHCKLEATVQRCSEKADRIHKGHWSWNPSLLGCKTVHKKYE